MGLAGGLATNGAAAQVGVELGYVEKADADFTTTSTTLVDVTGLTLTVTVPGGRPIAVEAGGPSLSNNLAGAVAEVDLVQVGNPTSLQQAQVSSAAASPNSPWHCRRRLSLAAGTYTFKCQLASIFGGGTSKVQCGANHPSWISVVQL